MTSTSVRSTATIAAMAVVSTLLAAIGAPTPTGDRAPAHAETATDSSAPKPLEWYLNLRPGAPLAACLPPDSNFTLQERLAIDAALAGPGAELRYQTFNSWTVGDTPGVLTWSIVPDGTNMDFFTGGSITADTFKKFDAVWPREQWIGFIEDAVNRWGDLTGITFQRVSVSGKPWDDGSPISGAGGTSTRGDIRIGAGVVDGQGGVLGLGFYPSVGDLIIDSGEMTRWSNPKDDFRGIRNALMHELGHNLGAMHTVSPTDRFLMEPWIDGSYYGPQHDDIRFGHKNYGDELEPNDSSSSAIRLGTISNGQTLRPTLIIDQSPNFASLASIHSADDSDWYEFTVQGPADVSVIVDPVGYTHSNGPQGGTAVANNSSRAANLLIDMSNTSNGKGTRENSTGLGYPEALTFSVGSGSSRIRVAIRASSFTDVQLYDLIISAGGFCPADLNTTNADIGTASYGQPDGVIDGADLSYFIEGWLAEDTTADVSTEHANPGDDAYGVSDGVVSGADLSYYVETWLGGCV